MRSRYRIREQRAAHFVTSTIVAWLPIFTKAARCDILIESYLHNNPVARGLVSAPEHWRYSSAHEWSAGAEPVLRCDPWR